MSVVVVGKNSFLASGLSDRPACADWLFLSHKDVSQNAGIVSGADVLINFAFDPRLMKEEYQQDRDIDSTLAKMISPSCRYVMLSSRMVYGDWHGNPFSEHDECIPVSVYGKNKLSIEQGLQKNVATENLTILRLSNIFGYEPGRHTFFGAALKSLADDNIIRLDISPDSFRDFLPMAIFQEMLVTIAEHPASGIFNVGSGLEISCGNIAEWLIQGYESGNLDATQKTRKGDFVLDTSKLHKQYDLSQISQHTVREACLECGRQLRYTKITS